MLSYIQFTRRPRRHSTDTARPSRCVTSDGVNWPPLLCCVTFLEEDVDAGLELDVLEHVVDVEIAAGEVGSAVGDGHVVDTRRRSEHQTD